HDGACGEHPLDGRLQRERPDVRLETPEAGDGLGTGADRRTRIHPAVASREPGLVVVVSPGVLQHGRPIDVEGRRAPSFGANRGATEEISPGVSDAGPGIALIQGGGTDPPRLS